MTNLTLLLIEMWFSEVFFEFCLYLIIGTFGLKLTLSKLNILAQNSDYRLANLYMLFDFALCDLYIACSAVDLNFVVEFHHNPIWLLHFCYSFAMWTCWSSRAFKWFFPLIDTVVTEQLFTWLAFSRLSDNIHANDTIELVLHFRFQL